VTSSADASAANVTFEQALRNALRELMR
jgi:hypothetical protein